MKSKSLIKCLVSVGLVTVLSGFWLNASASGFQLFEENGVTAGDYGAGGAAIAEDASTAYFNPAGLTRLSKQQIVLAGSGIFTYDRFRGTDTWASPLAPGFTFTKAGTAQGSQFKFIPAFHYALPFCNRWAFGLSATVPFGLVNNYGVNSVVNYSSTNTQLQVIDLSPSLAYKIVDKFSLGAGIDADYLYATINSVVGFPPGVPGSPSALDTVSKNHLDNWGYGWHAGALYEFTPETRVGLAYHSQVRVDATGTSKLVGPLAGPTGVLANTNVKSNVTLPPTTTLSAYHAFNPKWAVDGSINYTQWSTFNNILTLQNVQGVLAGVPVTGSVHLPLYFHNTWRFAAGTNYQLNQYWLVRCGLGFDRTPTSDTYRTTLLPDNDRYAVAIGARFQPNKIVGFDLGWTHLFFQSPRINQVAVQGPQVATITGSYSDHVDVIGGQVTWNIG